MNLSEQVTSLELSRKLKELGVKQESEFYIVFAKSIGDSILENEVPLIAHKSQCNGHSDEWISAFTASELLNLLPHSIQTKEDEPFNNYRFEMNIFHKVDEKDMSVHKCYLMNYYCDAFNPNDINWSPFEKKLLCKGIHSENLANCAAGLLITLIENKLIEV